MTELTLYAIDDIVVLRHGTPGTEGTASRIARIYVPQTDDEPGGGVYHVHVYDAEGHPKLVTVPTAAVERLAAPAEIPAAAWLGVRGKTTMTPDPYMPSEVRSVDGTHRASRTWAPGRPRRAVINLAAQMRVPRGAAADMTFARTALVTWQPLTPAEAAALYRWAIGDGTRTAPEARNEQACLTTALRFLVNHAGDELEWVKAEGGEILASLPNAHP